MWRWTEIDVTLRLVLTAPLFRIAVPRWDGVDLNLTRLLKKAELVRTDTLPAAVLRPR